MGSEIEIENLSRSALVNRPQLLNAFLLPSSDPNEMGSVETPVLLQWLRPLTLGLWVVAFCGELLTIVSTGEGSTWLVLLFITILFVAVHLQFWYEESEQGHKFHRTVDRMRGRLYEDEVTGLPNSRHFVSELRRQMTRSVRNGRGFSLVLTDLGGLEGRRGGEGDRMAPGLARAIRQAVSEGDFVARLHGVIFAAVVADDRDRSTSEKVDAITRAVGATIGLDLADQVYPVVSLTGYEGEVEVRDFLRRAQRDLVAARSHNVAFANRPRPEGRARAS
jgi:GGDEF domain-containing protein